MGTEPEPELTRCQEPLAIRVRGLVQGVGFRPHVYRTAQRLGIRGVVRNDAQGVLIEASGHRLSDFLDAVASDAPPLARIDSIETTQLRALHDYTDFAIAETRTDGALRASVPADAGLCPDCSRELFDPTNRRYGHPFITCTDCGPRFTITHALPYDRAQTAMSRFPMCPTCAAEYHDPADRRFHAEPIACPDCGPRLAMSVAEMAERVGRGEILALKGLGGFQLACDARDTEAVSRLRAVKQRDGKPFAVMVANVASAERFAWIDGATRAALESPIRPVVLCPAVSDTGLAEGVTNGLTTVGLMLPATPIHTLLFHALLGEPEGQDWRAASTDLALVMTSANRSGDPLIIDDAEAEMALAGVADAVAGHDRPILVRADDSVVRVIDGAPMVLRRARGYAPAPIRLPAPLPQTLALGAHLKSTITVTRGDEAFVSQHVGDLDTASNRAFLEETAEHLLRLTSVRPSRIACDLHDDFASSRLAAELAERFQVPLIAVQHHHAHVAAVTAEHGHLGPVLGLALDGFGLGTDDGAWGGELLLVEGADFTRLGHLATVPQPGGDTASREPWRMAAGLLHRLGRASEIPMRFGHEPQARSIGELLNTGFAQETSSAGRLFDAVAGLLGVCHRQRFEGEAPMRLEGLVTELRILTDGWTINDRGLSLESLLRRLAETTDPVLGANLFHGTLAAALVDWVSHAARTHHLRTVALGGGCWVNAALTERVVSCLRDRGLDVLIPRLVPPGDGGISLGQAVIAGQTEA